MIRMALALLMAVSICGCASIGKQWKSLISGGEAPKESERPQTVTYARNPNMAPNVYRKYKRTTRQDLSNEAQLDSKAGSLWVMEGQGAYYFSQNTVRMVGDPIGVRIEGDPADQLSAKAAVISKLLKQLEDRRRRALGRGPANAKAGDEKSEEASKDAAAAATPQPQPEPAVPNQQTPGSSSEGTFNVKNVPTRVVERLVDGNYRIKGMQPFMIGSREYKVIVSGIVRAEDFNEQGISSTQLLDANFDIVSTKGAEYR